MRRYLIFVSAVFLSGCMGYEIRCIPVEHGAILDDIEAAMIQTDEELPDAFAYYQENLIDGVPAIVEDANRRGNLSANREDTLAEIRLEDEQVSKLTEQHKDATRTFQELKKSLNMPTQPMGNLDKAVMFLSGALAAAGVALAL